MRKIYFKTLFVTLIILGIGFIIGATGSLDLNTLSVAKYSAIVAISVLLISFGVYGLSLYKGKIKRHSEANTASR